MAQGKEKATGAKYERIVLKLSGEALAGPQGFGISPEQARKIAVKVKDVHDRGVQVVVVIGAGNLWRGKVGIEHGMDRATADHMGIWQACALICEELRNGRPVHADAACQLALADLLFFHRAGQALAELGGAIPFVDVFLHMVRNITFDEFC